MLAQSALVIIQRLVHHVPFQHLVAVGLHRARHVFLQYVQQLLARPVLVVLLAVGRDPLRQLVVPGQRVPPHFHALLLGKLDEAVALSEIEIPLAGLYGVGLHLVLRHAEVEVLTDEVGQRGRRVGGHVVAPVGDGHTDALLRVHSL